MPMKRLLPLLLCLSVLPATAQKPQFHTAPQDLSVAAKSYALIDFQSGQTLASQSAHERIEPASLTKLMTAYVVFGALYQKRVALTQAVPVSERAWRVQGSRMFIEPSRTVTVDELMRGMIVQSGNDASIALAEVVAGSEDTFAQLMNKEAGRLGLKNTRFANSTGLPHPEHYSTAHDLGLLAAALRSFWDHETIMTCGLCSVRCRRGTDVVTRPRRRAYELRRKTS